MTHQFLWSIYTIIETNPTQFAYIESRKEAERGREKSKEGHAVWHEMKIVVEMYVYANRFVAMHLYSKYTKI